jgi:hypothetical protein
LLDKDTTKKNRRKRTTAPLQIIRENRRTRNITRGCSLRGNPIPSRPGSRAPDQEPNKHVRGIVVAEHIELQQPPIVIPLLVYCLYSTKAASLGRGVLPKFHHRATGGQRVIFQAEEGL